MAYPLQKKLCALCVSNTGLCCTHSRKKLGVWHSEATLNTNRWEHLLRITEIEPADGELAVEVPRTMLPPPPESPPPAAVTNITQSAYDPTLCITNIIVTNAVRTVDSGFFRLADTADSDGDGLSDAAEKWIWGTDPLEADTDDDGMPDGWEVQYGLDPLDAADGLEDADSDGLTNAEEFMAGTDPFNPDTDGDGLTDGWEIQYNLDPLDATGVNGANGDPDNDGFTNLQEFQMGGDPNNPAQNATQLLYRLMHSRGNASLRVDVEDSAICGGSNLNRQEVEDIFNVGQLMHCGYLLSITVKGKVEDHNAGYDKVSLRSYVGTKLQEEVHFFEGHGNYNECSMVSEQATSNVWFWSNGSVRLRYDTRDGLYHTGAYAEITAAAFVDFLRIESINATSPVAGTSGNPPPFEGHKPWLFDVTHSPQPDKHMVVFYKDVVDSSFNVDDFDVTLKANILPPSITVNQLNEVWSKISGPASGSLNWTDTFEVKYRNPKLGGVYRFDFDLGLSGCVKSEANVVLPLAGAEMDGVIQSDLLLADAFAAVVKAKYTLRELQSRINWRRWFWDQHAGDYTGRPDNAATPTVWFHNQVNDDSGFGAVCTWKGHPVRLTKPSNFILGYAMQKIGTSRIKARLGTGVFNFTETTDKASVGAGWDVANGANYDTTVSTLVDYIWTHEDDNDKSRKLWPNPNAPDNFKGSSSNIVFDYNLWYGSPGFLFKRQ